MDEQPQNFGVYDKFYPRQNKFAPSDQLVSQIHAEVKESRHKNHGLRVDNLKLPPGERLPESRRWKDGILTNETVKGVSTVRLPSKPTPDHIRQALNDLGPYEGKYLTLVGGKSSRKGEDAGESIIGDASTVAVYE
jgi:hypothetical protein